MVVSKTPGLKRSNGKRTNSIWFTATSPAGFSLLSPNELLWFMEYWQKSLALIHPYLPADVNSVFAPWYSCDGDTTSIYQVRMRSNLAIETLCLAAEQRGLNSAKIRAADLVIRKRLPQAAKWCFFENGAGCLHRAEDFLDIRFPSNAQPTADERQDFKQGIRELDRMRTKLEVESQCSLRLCIPRNGTRGYGVIKTLFEQKAFDVPHQMTAEEITGFADPCTDANNYKSPIRKLRCDGLIDTKPGKGGGCWLTLGGRQITSDLFKR